MEENSRLREENHQLRASGGREGAKSETNGMKEIISEMSKMQASMRAMEDRLTGAFAEGQPTAAAQMLASLPAPRRSALQQLLPNAPGRSTPPTFCVFIDGPDPDNFICVLSAFQLLAKPTGTTLHIILTGRPVNLHANLLTEEQRKEKMAAGVKFTDLLRAKEEDESHYEHSQAVLNDMLVRLVRGISLWCGDRSKALCSLRRRDCPNRLCEPPNACARVSVRQTERTWPRSYSGAKKMIT
jgi:hypothetical protein